MTSRHAEPDHSRDAKPSRELLMRMLPAQPSSLRPARAAIAEWLALLHWPRDDADDLVLAVSEAVTNVIEHAYPATHPGSLGLRAWCGPGSAPATRRATVTITDLGNWVHMHGAMDPANRRGHGLTVMSACTAETRVKRSAHGTTVTLISHDVPIR
jgi:anti-sigma regulatory factor (Ser/Thr protein kinase)